MAECCFKLTGALLRIVNVFVAMVGAVFVAYGAYLIVENGRHITALAAVLVALGAVVVFVAGLLVLCGHKSRCFMKFYLAVFGFLLVGEILLVCYFLLPSSRAALVKAINPPAAVKSEVDAHLKIAGFLVLGFIFVQLVTMLMAYYRSNKLDDKHIDKLAEDYNVLPNRDPDKPTYREKNAAMYEKYGIA